MRPSTPSPNVGRGEARRDAAIVTRAERREDARRGAISALKTQRRTPGNAPTFRSCRIVSRSATGPPLNGWPDPGAGALLRRLLQLDDHDIGIRKPQGRGQENQALLDCPPKKSAAVIGFSGRKYRPSHSGQLSQEHPFDRQQFASNRGKQLFLLPSPYWINPLQRSGPGQLPLFAGRARLY